MRLFHFSEEKEIKEFQPRVKANRQDMPPVVWAIEEAMAFTFYCPRNCPRIAYRRSPGISKEDELRFFGESHSNIVIWFETGWYKRLVNTTLYRYELPTQTFQLFDEIAGYYISREKITPSEVQMIHNPLERLMDMRIDIRFTPDLNPLKEALPGSTVNLFGIHRFEYAAEKRLDDFRSQ